MIISAEYTRLQNRVEQLEALNMTRGVTNYKKIKKNVFHLDETRGRIHLAGRRR